MIMNDAIRTILSCTPENEIVTCSQEDYYNNSTPEYKEALDVIKENSKLIILTK